MALDQDMDLLGRQPLLALMPREALRLIAFAAETRALRAGDVLFRRGSLAEGGAIVVDGAIAFDPNHDGAPSPVMAREGHLIGESALFVAVEHPATAVAREPTRVMLLPRALILRVLGEFPEAAAAIHAVIAARVRTLSDEIGQVRERLLRIDR
jgi:CRP-like cAMP-binding protein